jgi:hypothetical protein
MANQEQVDLLKRGFDGWNQWRQENPNIVPDLSDVNLTDTNLSGFNLSITNFNSSDLSRANLRGANLSRSGLIRANLSEANLSGSDLSEAVLRRADFTHSRAWMTHFTTVDLREVKGLDTVWHLGPSSIGIDTIYLSQGQIPEVFLRGAGVPEPFISNMHALVESMSPIDFYSCFISYSSKDQDFAERLYADLQSKGVRCWFAPENLKIGDKFWHRIDESIKLYDKLLVVLSEHSINSAWVENEVMAALEKEHQQPNKLVLFPIKLDETVMQTSLPWAASLRQARHIGDFCAWKQHDNYQKSLSRLLRDLKQS